jgi:hypothetical protein
MPKSAVTSTQQAPKRARESSSSSPERTSEGLGTEGQTDKAGPPPLKKGVARKVVPKPAEPLRPTSGGNSKGTWVIAKTRAADYFSVELNSNSGFENRKRRVAAQLAEVRIGSIVNAIDNEENKAPTRAPSRSKTDRIPASGGQAVTPKPHSRGVSPARDEQKGATASDLLGRMMPVAPMHSIASPVTPVGQPGSDQPPAPDSKSLVPASSQSAVRAALGK